MIDITQKLLFIGNGVSGTATKNSDSNLDFKITEDETYLNGGEILFQNAVWGDYVKVQIIDIDNIFGYGANFVLNEYIKKWYLSPDLHRKEVFAGYAGNIPNGIYIRLVYHSVGTETDVNLAVNWYLHKTRI